MLARIAAEQVDRFIVFIPQSRPRAHTRRELHARLRADLTARFDQGAGDVLRDQPFFVLPVLDRRPGDGRLQVAAVMVFGIPGAGWLVEAAQPDHGIGHHLVTDLEALEIVFLGADEVFAEYVKLLTVQAEDHVGIYPRIVLARMRLAVSRQSLGGHEHLELARGVFAAGVVVLGQRRTSREQCRERDQEEG